MYRFVNLRHIINFIVRSMGDQRNECNASVDIEWRTKREKNGRRTMMKKWNGEDAENEDASKEEKRKKCDRNTEK